MMKAIPCDSDENSSDKQQENSRIDSDEYENVNNGKIDDEDENI